MAEPVWLGTANDIKQETTIAVTGTWATSDTATLTINGNDLTVTIGALVTTADIVDVLVAAVNASSATSNLVGSESRNTGGQEIPEFVAVEAFDSGTTLTLKSRVAGVPFTVTASESTASTGALGTPTEAVAATGREHWDNADNWSTGSVPVNSDDVIDNRAAASIKYGLAQTAVTLSSLTITRGFANPKQIGLAQVRSTAAGSHYKYRATALAIKATTVTIGESSGTMSGLIRLDLSTAATTVNVQSTGTALETNVPALLVVGTHASNILYIAEGSSVGTAFFDGEAATWATIETAGTLTIGDGATLTNVDVNAGTFITSSATTTLDVNSGVATVLEGAHATVNVYQDGAMNYRSTGTITTLAVSGSMDFTLDPRGRTVTNKVTLHRGATFSDPNATVTMSGGFTISHGLVTDITLNLGYDRDYTVS